MTAAAKAIRTTVGLAATLVLLAACARPGLAGAGTGQQAGSTPSPATATTAAATPAGSPAAGSPSAGHTSAAPAVPTRCHTNELHASVYAGDNAAGHFGRVIVFTNVSGHTCNMYGFPGVSFLTGPHGSQINDPAARSTGEGGPALIALTVGAKAHADLLLVDTGNYSTSMCKPVTAAGILIYPPDETQSIFVASPQTICSVKGTGLAQVYPVQTGA